MSPVRDFGIIRFEIHFFFNPKIVICSWRFWNSPGPGNSFWRSNSTTKCLWLNFENRQKSTEIFIRQQFLKNLPKIPKNSRIQETLPHNHQNRRNPVHPAWTFASTRINYRSSYLTGLLPRLTHTMTLNPAIDTHLHTA